MLEQAALNQLMKITQTVSVNRKFILNVLKAIYFDNALKMSFFRDVAFFIEILNITKVKIQKSNYLNFLKDIFETSINLSNKVLQRRVEK